MSLSRRAYIIGLIGMLFLLICDTKIAVYGASQGIEMCLKSVIPSLFPFLFLSSLISQGIAQNKIRFSLLEKICHIPSGCEGIFLLGLLGGYPIGAKLLTQQYQSGKLSKDTAHRLMGFFNNPGPAFIFGILWGCFQDSVVLWVLWGVEILSAVLVGAILPKTEIKSTASLNKSSQDIVRTLTNCISTMSIICGWIVIFRILIAYLHVWLFSYLPNSIQVIFAGILELANGCHLLTLVQPISLRFIVCAGMLSFGGLCVTVQTISASSGLGLGWYLPGKLLQTGFTIALSSIVQYFLFSTHSLLLWPIVISLILIMPAYFYISRKNSSIFKKCAV